MGLVEAELVASVTLVLGQPGVAIGNLRGVHPFRLLLQRIGGIGAVSDRAAPEGEIGLGTVWHVGGGVEAGAAAALAHPIDRSSEARCGAPMARGRRERGTTAQRLGVRCRPQIALLRLGLLAVAERRLRARIGAVLGRTGLCDGVGARPREPAGGAAWGYWGCCG